MEKRKIDFGRRRRGKMSRINKYKRNEKKKKSRILSLVYLDPRGISSSFMNE